MGLDYSEAVTVISGGITTAFSDLSPLFLFIGGIVLALSIISGLLDRFFPQQNLDRRDDDVI